MATVVETQRLISVSLGKIAQSRAQRGGINLHKNLLVASVLNKARTAFMMENYGHQLLQQQKQQQQQIVLTAPQPTPVCNNSPASPESSPQSQHEGNCLSSAPHVVKTCPTPDLESRSTAAETTQVVSGHESVSPTGQHTAEPIATDKENISPSMEHTLIPCASELTPESKQQCVSGDQHIVAANQLSEEAQLAGSQSQSSEKVVYSSCRQSSSVGVLKRRRDNPEALTTNDSECSLSKKARVTPDCSLSQSQTSSCDLSYSSSCEYESDNQQSDMHSTDSPQITNLVTILNSGFSGLCVSSSSSSSFESSHESDSSSSISHQWSNSSNQSHHNHNQHCSSQVGRIGSLSSAIVLSA